MARLLGRQSSSRADVAAPGVDQQQSRADAVVARLAESDAEPIATGAVRKHQRRL
jgi:hypothetical protein